MGSMQKTRQKRDELTFSLSCFVVHARRVWSLEVSSEFLILLRGPIWRLATTRPFGELSSTSHLARVSPLSLSFADSLPLF